MLIHHFKNVIQLCFLLFFISFFESTYGCQPDKMDFSGCTLEQIPESVKIYNLGTVYHFGLGETEIDVVKACDLFEESAEMDFGLAQYNLGHCYRKGKGKQSNIQKAVYWLEKAVDNNVKNAKTTLGALYLYEATKPENYIRGAYLLQQAKKEGSDEATLTLGTAYYGGLGVEQDYTKAIELYKEAAKKGNIGANALLSHIYVKGLYGLEPDIKKAKYWRDKFPFLDLSPKGEVYRVTVEEFIATAYKKGFGLPKSEEKYKYYLKRSTKYNGLILMLDKALSYWLFYM